MNAEIVPRYGTAIAAHAVGVEYKALVDWLTRDKFRLGNTDKDTRGTGDRRKFSARSIRRLAVMAAMTRQGVGLARANRLATTIMAGYEQIGPYARSFAIVGANEASEVVTIGADTLESVFDRYLGSGDSLLIVDLTRLFARADAKLLEQK